MHPCINQARCRKADWGFATKRLVVRLAGHAQHALFIHLSRDAIPAHYGGVAKPSWRTKRKERWEGVLLVSWQHLVMCILLLTTVYGWISAQRCTGSRCDEPTPRLGQFVYAGNFHRSRQHQSSDSVSTATRSLLLAQPGAVAAGYPKKADTLVVYVYSPTDPEYANNLRYFLRQGVHDNDGCDYVFVLQSVRPNAHYLWQRVSHFL